MKKRKTFAAVLAAALLLTGCANISNRELLDKINELEAKLDEKDRSSSRRSSSSSNFEEPADYSSSDSEWPQENTKMPAIGETLTFGTYEQDNNSSNGSEDIEWVVIDKQDNRVMIISKYCLVGMPYNSRNEQTSWAKCSLRRWLNGTFLDQAFTSEEMSRIVTTKVPAEAHPDHPEVDPGNDTSDKVFLLSMSEAKNYLLGVKNALYAAPTEYAQKQDNIRISYGVCNWWLRTMSSSDTACYVKYDGAVSGYKTDHMSVNYDRIAVRPALWITM